MDSMSLNLTIPSDLRLVFFAAGHDKTDWIVAAATESLKINMIEKTLNRKSKENEIFCGLWI